ncbi:hypothetical protein Q31b_19850 [Novipirellula aureliae]|uniref:Uncharacterized protein n=1 Tax=Novipirellula aureliae TaxID=2527966 RepID=A0A5C6E5Q1_9BACT|nr:hypothetical protein Q31b_19850 [Novipirellula aureliae]
MANWAVQIGLWQIGLCKLGCANWAVQIGLCKLGCANWAVQIGLCKLGYANWAMGKLAIYGSR